MGKSPNDILYDRALLAIRLLYQDDTVSPEDTRSNLEQLLDEIEIMIETLPDENDYEEE